MAAPHFNKQSNEWEIITIRIVSGLLYGWPHFEHVSSTLIFWIDFFSVYYFTFSNQAFSNILSCVHYIQFFFNVINGSERSSQILNGIDNNIPIIIVFPNYVDSKPKSFALLFPVWVTRSSFQYHWILTQYVVGDIQAANTTFCRSNHERV